MAIGVDVDRALSLAIAYLARRQLPTGELPVQRLGTPEPSVFPTALAAHALSFARGAAMIRQRALDFLAAEMDAWGLWRHWARRHPRWHRIPPDLDDTSCASAALARAGRPVPDNRAALLSNRNRDGLFFTWKLTAAQYRHPFVLAAFFWQTVCRPSDLDAVVNANVLHYLGATAETRPVITHLLAVLRDDRETSCDKWYNNRFVVWYFFSRALHQVAPEARDLIEPKLARAAPGDALDRALAACSLLYWNRLPAIDALVGAQLDSGGWPSAPLYHGGRLRRRDGSFALPELDAPSWGSEELTTAFCIEALSRWKVASRP
jgi:hypothetical protein